MELTLKQREIAKDTTRFRVLCCGRGFGKTTYALEEAIGVAVAKSNRKVGYIAMTIQQARDVAWDKLTQRVKPITVATNKSLLEVTVRTQDNGTSKIVLRGWEAVETLRGQEFDFFVLDEVAFMRDFWYGWRNVLRPTLRISEGGAMFISTPKGFNHFYDLYNLEADDKDFKSFHATSYDNPFISEQEIESAKQSLPDDVFAQEYLADFRKQEGLVYKEFNRQLHVVNEEPESLMISQYIAGIDFGFRNPAAVIHIKQDLQGRYWITGEWYQTEQTDAQIADYVKECRFNYVYPDPENQSAIKELRDRHVNVREVVKSNDSVKAGVNQIRELLKQNRLFVHRRCLSLINEFETYAYPDEKDGKVNENPVKKNDHALDALRYAIMTHTPKTQANRYNVVALQQERLRNLRPRGV
jgi:PBSX family phage terminase large subunit